MTCWKVFKLSLKDELNVLVEDGYKIADMRNIIGLKKKVYRSNEPGFKENDNNFGHMAVQEINAHQYEMWFSEVTKTFERFGLQKAKFRIYADTFDPETESNLSAQRFLKRLHALERITQDEEFRKTFVSKTSKPPWISIGIPFRKETTRTRSKKNTRFCLSFYGKIERYSTHQGKSLKKPTHYRDRWYMKKWKLIMRRL